MVFAEEAVEGIIIILGNGESMNCLLSLNIHTWGYTLLLTGLGTGI